MYVWAQTTISFTLLFFVLFVSLFEYQPIRHPPPDKTTGYMPYLSACVPCPPLTTTTNIFTPLTGTFLIKQCCSAPPFWVTRCPSKHPFCPQKTALPSCSQSPWWWPSRGNLDKVGSNVIRFSFWLIEIITDSPQWRA